MSKPSPDDYLDGLAALARNAAWAIFNEKLAALAKNAAEMHEDEAKTPGDRAEWLHAMKKLRELSGWWERESEKAKKILRTRESR